MILARQILNIIRIANDYLRSFVCKNGVLRGKPIAASVEPANFCNLSCPHCPTGMGIIDKKNSCMSMEQFCSVINMLSPELYYLNLYFQGEPFLNKQLADMVSFAHDKNIYTCISTNGHFLSRQTALALKNAGLDKLIISMDGYDESSYTQYRKGGSFSRVKEGIKTAVEAGLNVEMQCLLLSSTENGLGEVKKLARECGVKRLKFKTAQLYSDYLMPEHNKLSRYVRQNDGRLQIKRKMKNRCWRLWSGVVVNTDGEVLPCCYDKAAEYSFGNVFEADFKEVWNSQRAVAFRKRVLNRRGSIDICRNCW